MRKLTIPLLLLMALTAVAGCNMPGVSGDQSATATGDANATAAAQTVAAELTAAANQPTETPLAATSTAEAGATATLAATATATEAACTDRATFVNDVTIPDDTFMDPGEDFTKTWRLRNSGTCTWSTEYDLVFASGQAMSGPASTPLVGSVPPNSTVDISVDLTAPNTNGTHRGNWMLRNADNLTFGIGAQANGSFWVQVIVGPTPTPEASVYNNAKITLNPSFHADLDEGESPPAESSDRDIWYHNVGGGERYLEPRDGAKAFVYGGSAPDFEDCDTDDLSEDPISFDDFSQGDWVCFETDSGRIGRFEIEEMVGDPPVLTIDIRTWEN